MAKDDIETFVIVHSAELILRCESEGRFTRLPSYTYLFVGNGDVSRLDHLDNLVVARDLADNIEQYSNLLSFTGWYAVARNGLATTRWVTLLEYDVHLQEDFVAKTLSALKAGASLVGYVPFPLSHPLYLHATPWLIPALRSARDIDAPRLIADHLRGGGADEWTATTNASFTSDDFVAFVDWFIPVSRLIRHDPIGAHVHERTLTMFCMLRGLRHCVIRNVLGHEQAGSHKISIPVGHWGAGSAEG